MGPTVPGLEQLWWLERGKVAGVDQRVQGRPTLCARVLIYRFLWLMVCTSRRVGPLVEGWVWIRNQQAGARDEPPVQARAFSGVAVGKTSQSRWLGLAGLNNFSRLWATGCSLHAGALAPSAVCTPDRGGLALGWFVCSWLSPLLSFRIGFPREGQSLPRQGS